MKTLLLVDGSSYLYRAFHALPDLRNRRGEATGAIYGVINMLRRLQKETPADYLACVLDAKGRTFRDDVYPAYKATRAPMPDDLSLQVEPLKEAILALGWPLLEIPGVEADDVIGTLARDAEREGLRVVISTGDKDMAQLVSPQVTLVNTMSNEMLDEPGVEKKFGIGPRLIVDYLALIGDSVDNVPGVAKVGPKTAVKWLLQYGTLDGVIEHAAEVGGVVGENLRTARDWLPQARGLLTIKCDVPLPVKPSELALRPRDGARLAELFERFEFKTWRRELEDQAAAAESPAPAREAMARTAGQCDYELVVTEEQLNAWLLRLEGAELAAVDTETTSLDPFKARLVGLSVAVEPAGAAYLPVAHRYTGAPEQL
ncbi:MAG TPA: 5'-3' exonuclease H3TH domain-containing protein, partial [Burkholderiales bacterium]|nr:5'-3' exonuclease H3TH domain-containing protein [Burkholderiales bacterium]